MIKLEVDTRLACDRETKALNEAAIKKVVEEFTLFKEDIEKKHNKLMKDLKEANAENSERANFLSRYIDEQIRKLDEQIDEQLKKIKVLCAKLTEQVKEHFQAEELNLMQIKSELLKNTEEFNNKFNGLDDYIKTSIYKTISEPTRVFCVLHRMLMMMMMMMMIKW